MGSDGDTFSCYNHRKIAYFDRSGALFLNANNGTCVKEEYFFVLTLVCELAASERWTHVEAEFFEVHFTRWRGMHITHLCF